MWKEARRWKGGSWRGSSERDVELKAAWCLLANLA